MKYQLLLNLKENSFNVLRLALALSVLLAHSFELGGFGYDPVYYFSGNIYSIGAIAVDCFFAISGLLITASYKNINSLFVFFWHRVLRIFPGFWFCIILTAIFLPVVFNVKLDFGYALHNSLNPAIFSFQSAIGFLQPLLIGWAPDLGNINNKLHFFGQAGIAGILNDRNVNGSLWSLSEEFRLYGLIAFLGVTGLLRKQVLVFLLLMSWIAYCFLLIKHPSWSGLAGASSFRTTAHFLVGAVFYFWTPIIRHSFAIIAIIISVLALRFGFYPVVSPFTTAYLIIYLAIIIPMYDYCKTYDFSYGVYIFAFPIQTTLTGLSLNRFGLFVYFILSLLLTMVFACLSWYLIEKNAMKLRKLKFKLPFLSCNI